MIEVKNILCPVDFTPIYRRNVRMAVEMSKRIGSRIILYHNQRVRPPNYLSVKWMWSEEHEAKEQRMATAEHDSLTERIIIRAPCSVLTIGEGYIPEEVFDAEHESPPEKMKFLVPVGFSPRSREVLDFAFAVAEGMPHRVTVLHVVEHGRGPEKSARSDREVADVEQRILEMLPESVADRTSYQVKVGNPAKEILKAAEEQNALCVVMGAQGKSLLRRSLFGTTTMSILHGASCPVWFVPQAARKRLSRMQFETAGGA